METGLQVIRDAPFRLSGLYRTQSRKRAAVGGLRGRLIHSATNVLNHGDVNRALREHPSWDDRSSVTLQAALMTRRSGIFREHADALYYRDNFSNVRGAPALECDLLDVTKLTALFAARVPLLRAIFTAPAFDRLLSGLQAGVRAAINEYMCHEAGHRIGYACDAKFRNGFFRIGGKLRWPLVYMEEFRADVNSWDIAMRALDADLAAEVVLYTMAHRFGLAAANLGSGRPGGGYVPYLHFAVLVETGLLTVTGSSGRRPRLDLHASDANAVVRSARCAVAALDREINSRDVERNDEISAEAMLDYAIRRLGDRQLTAAFAQIIGGPDRRYAAACLPLGCTSAV